MQKTLESIMENYLKEEGNVISLLQDIQDSFGYIPQEAVAYVSESLDIPKGEDTSEDRKFTWARVNCVGACSIAPVVIINKEVYGKMTAESLMKEIKRLKSGE